MFSSLELPETPLSKATSKLFRLIGRTSNAAWLLLLAVIIVNVSMRYLLGEGRVELEELQWHLNAIAFMLAIVYVFDIDSHVRIDLLSQNMQPRTLAWIELYGSFILLLPFLLAVLIFSIPFVEYSFSTSEVSQSPGGLPLRWLLKAFIPFTVVLLLIALASRLSRIWKFLQDEQP